MKRIYVASPLSAPTPAGVRANVQRVWALCKAVLAEGHAPFAPHGFYPAFLDDSVASERAAGMDAGLTWLGAADELWVYTKAGISVGMAMEMRVFGARLEPKVVYDPECWAGIE